MKLKEFIKSSLCDIIDAVKETQEEYRGVAYINPQTNSRGGNCLPITAGYSSLISNIDFDVAVTAGESDSDSVGSKVGVSVAGMFKAQIGADGKSSSSRQNVSRIQFSIPVALPSVKAKSPYEVKPPV